MSQAYIPIMLLAVAGFQEFRKWLLLAGQKALTTVSLWMVAKTVLTTVPCAAKWTQHQHAGNRVAVQTNHDAAT